MPKYFGQQLAAEWIIEEHYRRIVGDGKFACICIHHPDAPAATSGAISQQVPLRRSAETGRAFDSDYLTVWVSRGKHQYSSETRAPIDKDVFLGIWRDSGQQPFQGDIGQGRVVNSSVTSAVSQRFFGYVIRRVDSVSEFMKAFAHAMNAIPETFQTQTSTCRKNRTLRVN